MRIGLPKEVKNQECGCCETSHATTHDQPTYIIDRVLHYCVANMRRAAVPRFLSSWRWPMTA